MLFVPTDVSEFEDAILGGLVWDIRRRDVAEFPRLHKFDTGFFGDGE